MKKLTCEICGAFRHDRLSYVYHLFHFHFEYKCPLCSKKTMAPNIHMESDHPSAMPYDLIHAFLLGTRPS